MRLHDRARALVELTDAPSLARGDFGQPSQREKWQHHVQKFESLVRAGVPRRALEAADCPEVERTKALIAAISWATEAKQETLALSGLVGTGKTVAAARFALSVRATWCHAPLLGLDEYAKASRRIEDLIDAPHLVIDEVGGQGTTRPHAVARIAAVLSARYASRRPTVLTTNLSATEFAKVYDGVPLERSRLVDRIREGGSWILCERPQGEAPSFRATGGLSARSRYEHARRLLRLVELAQAGSADESSLDEIQRALSFSDEDIQLQIERSAARQPGLTDKAAAMVRGLMDRTRPHWKSAPLKTCSSMEHGADSLSPYGSFDSIGGAS